MASPIKDRAVILLREAISKGQDPDYEAIAQQIRAERPGGKDAKTTAANVAWYRHMHKTEIDRAAPLDGVSGDFSTSALDSDDNLADVEEDIRYNLSSDEEEVENWVRAQDVIVAYELSNGRQAEDVGSVKEHGALGYDIKSLDTNGRERHIEVKSSINRHIDAKDLTENETRVLFSDPDYWLYLVEGDVALGSVKIVEINREDLLKTVKVKIIGGFTHLAGLIRKQFSNKPN